MIHFHPVSLLVACVDPYLRGNSSVGRPCSIPWTWWWLNEVADMQLGAKVIAILSNGQGGFDMASAVRQWCLFRHLVSLAVAVVTEFGFGITPSCYTVIELYSAVWLLTATSPTSLFCAILLELREIVLTAYSYRGRNEVLRASLSPKAHNALSRGLEGGELLSPKKPNDTLKSVTSREESLRSFLSNDWVTRWCCFLHTRQRSYPAVPYRIFSHTQGLQIYVECWMRRGKHSARTNDAGQRQMLWVKWSSESLSCGWIDPGQSFIVLTFWSISSVADLAVKRLATKQSSDSVESNRLMMAGFALALQRFICSLQMAHDPYKCADSPGDFE